MKIETMKTRNAFCVNEQLVTEHQVSIDLNGEFLFQCECGSFFKLPGDFGAKEIDKALEAHEAENKGKVSLEAQLKINAEKLKNI